MFIAEETKKEIEKPATATADESSKNMLTGFLFVSTIGLLISNIVLATKSNTSPVPEGKVNRRAQMWLGDLYEQYIATEPADDMQDEGPNNLCIPDNEYPEIETIFSQGENTCAGMNPLFPNVDCIHLPGPQAGANVTRGYQGEMEVDVEPNVNNFWQSSMCPVNVHWHLGTEHYSVGQYDEYGDGPNGNADAPENRALAEDVRGGFRCHYYDASDPRFTTEYDWKHCVGMEVGETYEVHWPHSAAGACGTVNQYQTPFYEGVFCNLPVEAFLTLGPQDVANAVGVQGQVFTIVNDDSYFYPDMIRGWIVDGDYGSDISYYTGSTTGTSRNNEICSQYTPITWQVDRTCHLISASSFDKLCYDMKMQRADMTGDLHAHGARELVSDVLAPNNFQRRNLHVRAQDHDEHSNQHDHDDEQEWI